MEGNLFQGETREEMLRMKSP